MKLPPVYPILDTETFEARGFPWNRAAAAFLEGGAGILQLRHKQHWGRAVFDRAREIASWCREAGALFIVNDRADYAKMLGAGLHLGQDDLSPRAARELLGADAVIGYSTHNAHAACAAAGEPVDYVALGPVIRHGIETQPRPGSGSKLKRMARAGGATAGGDRRHHPGERARGLGRGRGHGRRDRRSVPGNVRC